MELIERLEALSAPCREVDAEIAFATGWRMSYGAWFTPEQASAARKARKSIWTYGGISNSLAYTASIDAAMTLVPEGCGVAIFRATIAGASRAELENLAGHEFCADATTPAIALCIAALKATHAGEGQPNDL